MKKQPKQKRSQVMVDAILQASTQVLSKVPLKSMTTNKIADLAGVSIGSLYEYFPNKKDIVIALMDGRMQSLLKEYQQALESHDSIEGVNKTVIEMIEREYLLKKKFLREIFNLAPESGRIEALYLSRIQAQKSLEKFFIEKLGKNKTWAETKSFIVINAVLGVVEMYIFVDENKMTHDDFKNEIENIILSVLK